MPLDDLFNKINRVSAFDVRAETIDIINQNHAVIENLLRTQLTQGKDGRGKPVTVWNKPYYAKRTRREKTGLPGLAGETRYITNYMSGYFYSSLHTVAQGDSFETKSDAEYFDDIIAQSGSVIMELDNDNLAFFRDNILVPQLQQRFNKIFNS